MTITLQIGNSDNKLSQLEWSDFVHELGKMLSTRCPTLHFHGCSHGSAPWQNAAWIAQIQTPEALGEIYTDLGILAHKFRQDSIALTLGTTKFVAPAPAQ